MQTDTLPQESGNWFEKILESAISQKASDIHLEPSENTIYVRFRIDGSLKLYEELPLEARDVIAAKIKVEANLDITNHRLPQDGHIQFQIGNSIHSIRLSTIPTQYGETLVMRILNRADMQISIEKTGFEPLQLEIVKRLLLSSNGLILSTGPTGSGKSSLLYSLLTILNTRDKNILTVEDPVELTLPKINQSQVNEKAGLNYAVLLRAVLRQDPDVVMIGEIRDKDTLQLTMQSALSGVLALSTFHSFGVPALLVRLIELGMTRSVIAQAICGIVSCRLVRKICAYCSQPHPLSEIEKTFLGEAHINFQYKAGIGCESCGGSGYKGRTGVFEVVPFDYEIRSFVIDNQPLSNFYNLLYRKRIKSLKYAGIQKAVDGITTVEEVIRRVGFEF